MSLRRHIGWMGTGQGIYLLIQFLSSVIIARILTPYQMGVYAIALAIVALVGAFQAFGLTGFLVREPDLTPELIVTAFSMNMVISVVFAAIIAILSLAGGLFLHEAGVKRVMLILAIIPLANSLEFLPSSLNERHARFHIAAPVGVCKTLISQGGAVVLALRGFGYMSIAYGQLAAAVFGAVTFMYIGRKELSFKVNFHHWRRVSRFGLQMLTISGVSSIGDRLSEAALGRIAGLSALGVFSRATNLNNIVWENIHLVTGRVLLVDLAGLKRSGISLRERYLDIVRVNTALLWPAFIGLAVVSGPFILAVYGPKWVGAAHPLAFLATAAVLNVSITLTWELFVVCQETHRQARIETVRAMINLCLFTFGCFFGLTGAAAGRAAGSVVNIILYRSHLNRMTETQTRDFLPIYANSIILTLVAITPAFLIMCSYRFSEHAPLTLVTGSVILGGVLWVATLFIIKHPLSREFRKLMSRGSSLLPRGKAKGITEPS